jgi:hypothetical protein
MKKQVVLTAVASLLTLASVAVVPAFAQDTGGNAPTPTQREEFSRSRRGGHERGHEWQGKGDWRRHGEQGSQRYGYGSSGKGMDGKDWYGQNRHGKDMDGKDRHGNYRYGQNRYQGYGSADKGSYGNYGKGGSSNYGYGYGSPRMAR